MTDEQYETTLTMLADAGIASRKRIADLERSLKEAESILSSCRVALHNIAGMALEQFPELAETCDRRDPYELIRQAFLKMRERSQ